MSHCRLVLVSFLFLVVFSTLSFAATFTVSNLNDSGAGSLRKAVTDANANAGADVIDFQAGLTGAITLTTGELAITDALTISGPGAANLTISGNNASRVFNVASGVNASISGLTISNGNAVGDDGGGIYNGGTLTISNCTLSGNSASFGGGIANINAPSLTIISSTVSGNSATKNGGGIYSYGKLTIINSTVSGNSAVSGVGGGLEAFVELTMSSSTVSGNSALGGGGIYNLDTWTVKSSIVGGNTSGGDCLGVATSDLGSNLDTDGSCVFTTVTAAQLKLGPLAGNGGPTQTMALLAGSVAVDAAADCTDASGNTLATDQRGVARPVGPACDIGAFEQEPIQGGQTVAVDSQGRFVIYAAPAAGCATDLLFYQMLDSLGNPIGAPLPLISCGLLAGNALGIDTFNGSSNDYWLSFGGSDPGDGKYLMKVDSLGNILINAKLSVPAGTYASIVGATALAPRGCCKLQLYASGAGGSILRSLIDKASLALLKTKKTIATSPDPLNLQVTQRKQVPAFLALTQPDGVFRAFELNTKGLPDGTTWRLSPRTDGGHELGSVSADGLAALSNNSKTPTDTLYLQMLGSNGRPVNDPTVVAVDSIFAVDISNELSSSRRFVVYATDDGRVLLQVVDALTGAKLGRPIALN